MVSCTTADEHGGEQHFWLDYRPRLAYLTKVQTAGDVMLGKSEKRKRGSPGDMGATVRQRGAFERIFAAASLSDLFA